MFVSVEYFYLKISNSSVIRFFLIVFALMALSGCGSSSSNSDTQAGQLSIDAVDLSN